MEQFFKLVVGKKISKSCDTHIIHTCWKTYISSIQNIRILSENIDKSYGFGQIRRDLLAGGHG